MREGGGPSRRRQRRPLSYLLQLLELELLDREKRAAERRLKAARFPTIKTLETFDFAARPSINKVLIAELARCEWLEKRENMIFVGNPGTGKSHLATALAAQACQKGYKLRFFRTTELVTALIEARDERSFLRLKNQLGLTCWSSTSSAMCWPPRSAPSCSSTSSRPPTSAQPDRDLQPAL